jgi:hypothetical protein
VYEDALQKDLPLDVRTMVERQYRGVLQNLESVRALQGRTESRTSTTSRTFDREAPPPM